MSASLHLGETVLYTVDAWTAGALNKRRSDYSQYSKGLITSVPAAAQAVDTGHQAHVGNSVAAGQKFPAVLVRDWDGCWNLKVQLDGTDVYWATSVSEGEGPGKFQRILPATELVAAGPAPASGNTIAPHPSVAEILRWFEYDHLPEKLQALCKPIHRLAHDMANNLSGAQLTHGLHALWQAKNYFVTAAIAV